MDPGSPHSGHSTGDRPAGTRPTVVVGNAADADRRVGLRCRRGGHETADAASLAPGETRTLVVPDGTGPATVELHARHAAATTTFDPAGAGLPPLFALREDGVVVVRG